VFGSFISAQGIAVYTLDYMFTVGTLNLVGTFAIGWISLFTLGFYALYRITHGTDEKEAPLRRAGDIFAGLSVFFTFATTAHFPWEVIEKIPVVGTMMGSLQFPNRCLTLAEVCFAAVAAFTILLWFSSKKSRISAAALTVCVSIACALLFYEFAFVRENAETIPGQDYYETNMGNSRSVSQAEYLVEGSNLDDMVADPPVLESDNKTFTVENFKRNGTKMSFEYTVDLPQGTQTMIALPITYIPNYVIKVDGVRIQPVKYEGGKVAFEAPAQQGSVTVAYTEPRAFRVFELISLLALACCIFLRTGLTGHLGRRA
jgi:hypothetical protein